MAQAGAILGTRHLGADVAQRLRIRNTQGALVRPFGDALPARAPALSQGARLGDDEIGQGRMLPTMAVDQLAATLATRMGVSSTELRTVVPNIGSYTQTKLGFLT